MSRDRATARRGVVEPLAAAVVVTAAVTAASRLLPERFIATAVGAVFLGATWLFVWRGDDASVERSGLTLGGLVMPGKLDARAVLRAALIASAWALAFAAIAFIPFFYGWRAFWHPHSAFSFPPIGPLASDAFGQLVIIALPEEAFYRGYMQSRFDDLFPPTFRVGGALVGPGIFITSVIFALGHLATIHDPARLAVFFPSLVFGWLRARTGGIGASCAFHALCNVFSELLGRGFAVY